MYGLSAGTKTSGSCKEVALSGGLETDTGMGLYFFLWGFFWAGGGVLISRRLWYTDMYYI